MSSTIALRRAVSRRNERSGAGASAEGRAAILWTGGKDSTLALVETLGQRVPVTELVTFAPPRGRFRAHPLSVMRLQARSLRLPHRVIRLVPPYRMSYRRAFAKLRDEGFTTVVTGDVDSVGGWAPWVGSIAEPLGLRVLRPLWRRDRRQLLRSLDAAGIEAVVSYVATDRLPGTWVGRPVERAWADDLAAAQRDRGIDPVGENGEYHTWTLNGPGFRARLSLDAIAIRSDARGAWLDPSHVSLGHPRRPAWSEKVGPPSRPATRPSGRRSGGPPSRRRTVPRAADCARTPTTT